MSQTIHSEMLQWPILKVILTLYLEGKSFGVRNSGRKYVQMFY